MCRHNQTGMQECRNRLPQGCTQESPCFWCHPVTFKVTVVDKCSLNLALKGCCPGCGTRLRGGQPGQAMLSMSSSVALGRASASGSSTDPIEPQVAAGPPAAHSTSLRNCAPGAYRSQPQIPQNKSTGGKLTGTIPFLHLTLPVQTL